MNNKNYSADVVVVGEGLAGLSTALSAAEQGLKVLIVTASKEPVGRGGAVHASFSRLMKEQGYERQEVEKFYLEELASQSYQVDQRKWYRFYNHSEEAMNWIMDHLEGSGIKVVLEISNQDDPESPTNQPVGTHGFMVPGSKLAGSGIKYALQVMEDHFKALGGEVFRQHIARRLVREEDGERRVTGVIAQSPDGSSVLFEAGTAVVLATGDFSANPDMMQRYCPAFAKYFTNREVNYDAGMITKGLYRGEGHQMALEAGAAWQKTFPNAVMIQGSRIGSHMPNGSHRGLRLNVRGERFCNEDCNGAYTAITVLREPEQKAWGIWDHAYAGKLEFFAMGGTREAKPLTKEQIYAVWDRFIKAGRIVKADTLEELFEQIGIPVEKGLAQVRRYNELCEKGVDEDFHKKAKYLQTIKDGPFYAGILHDFYFLTVLGGPRTNADMQICDEQDDPIPGLYGVGTIAGDMFADCYNYRIAGHNYGCCLTFGYLTGRKLAEAVHNRT